MGYIGNSINDSATLAEKTGAAISGGAGLAVKYNAGGDVVCCNSAGEAALGILVAQTPDCAAGAEVSVQIKDVGLWKCGAAITKGALLTTDSTGRAIPAVAGNFILGVALGASGAAGKLIPVQICKCGYKAA